MEELLLDQLGPTRPRRGHENVEPFPRPPDMAQCDAMASLGPLLPGDVVMLAGTSSSPRPRLTWRYRRVLCGVTAAGQPLAALLAPGRGAAPSSPSARGQGGSRRPSRSTRTARRVSSARPGSPAEAAAAPARIGSTAAPPRRAKFSYGSRVVRLMPRRLFAGRERWRFRRAAQCRRAGKLARRTRLTRRAGGRARRRAPRGSQTRR